MASPLDKLLRRTDTTGARIRRLVSDAKRSLRGELAEATEKLDLAKTANARESVIEGILRRIARLGKRIDKLQKADLVLAGKAAAEETGNMIGLEVKYDRRHAKAIIDVVTPAQGKNLAAVFTRNMSENLVRSLRQSVVDVMREGALAGMSLPEQSKAMRERWDSIVGNEDSWKFTDSAGRKWEAGRYFQMNARTNAMRVYNDTLCDEFAQHGCDLVRVSEHGAPDCKKCAEWEGKIISVTGKTPGFPTYAEAREAGLFHPNCTHTLEYLDETELEDLGIEPNAETSKETAGGNKPPIKQHAEIRMSLPAKANQTAVSIAQQLGLKRSHTPLDLMLANDFDKGEDNQKNCANCSVSVYLRWQGYDVTAAPLDSRDPTAVNALASWKYKDKIELTDEPVADINRIMSEWGDGAVAQIRVATPGIGEGHIFNAFQIDGETRLGDGQTGNEENCYRCIQNIPEGSFEKGRCWILRLDTNELLPEAIKRVQKRD